MGGPSSGGSGQRETLEPLRLSYHSRRHYNLLWDPLAPPDAGVALGLPSFELVDAMQLRAAKAESEDALLESEMIREVSSRSEHQFEKEATRTRVEHTPRNFPPV